MKKIILAIMLTVSMPSFIYAEQAVSSSNQGQKISDISNEDNPFYPKYLNENIQRAVNELVQMELKDKRKKLEALEKKERERIKKERIKKERIKKGLSAKTYQKVPSSITIRTLTKSKQGEFILHSKDGKIIKRGKRLLGGTVIKVSKHTITLDRVEKRKKKRYLIDYIVIF